MTKEVNANAATTATILQNKMEEYSNVSIRKLAQHHEISYARLLNASRKPVEGQIYDPEARNWNEMAKVLGVDKIQETPWEELNTVETKVSVSKNMDAFKLGDKVYLRRDNETPYEIVHITKTHVVIQQVDTETPFCWSHGTFLINGPVFEKRVKVAKEAEVETDVK